MKRIVHETARFVLLTLAMMATVALLALAEVSVLWSLDVRGVELLPFVAANVTDLSLSVDGRWGASLVRVYGSEAQERFRWKLICYDMQHPEREISLDVDRWQPHELAISPTGDAVAFVGGPSLILWRRAGNQRLQPFEMIFPRTTLEQLTWSPDARQIAVVGERFVYFWHASSGKLVGQLDHGGVGFTWLGFSRDSRKLLAAGADAYFRLWDLTSGELIWTQAGNLAHAPGADEFSPAQIASCVASSHVAFGVSDGVRSLGQLAARQQPLPVAFSPEDARVAALVSAGETSRIELRCPRSGKWQGQLAGHKAAICGLAFAADNVLYSWDQHGVILGWNVQTQRPIWRFSCEERAADAKSSRHFLGFLRPKTKVRTTR